LPFFILAAQLALNRLHLLVEVVLLLRLFHLLLDARLDAAIHLEFVDLGLEHGDDARQPLNGGHDFEKILLFFDAHLQMARNGVRQARRVVDPHGRDHRVVLQIVRELDVLLEEPDHAAHHRFGVRRRLGLLLDELHRDAEKSLVFLPLHRAGAFDAFDEHLDVAVGQLQRLHDVRDAAHRVDVGRLRIIRGRVVLRRQEDALVGRQCVLERAGRRRPSNHERHHHVREHDHVPKRDDGKSLVMVHG
jgi:hypothetical protein